MAAISLLSHNVTAMSLHDRIRMAFKSLDISQAEAARRAGMSAQRFGNYCTGKRTPDLAALIQIAKALQTTPDDLLGVSGSTDEDLLDILGRLLELEGLDRQRAHTIARAASEARRLLQALPGEGDAADRRRLAAHAVWSAQQIQ